MTTLDREKYGVHLYEFEPPRRNEYQSPEDITTFHAHQKDWGFQSKEQRPAILFQLRPGVGQFPHKSQPVPSLEVEVDGVTKIVLDVFSHRPLRDFMTVPLQLATNVEGGRLEAMSREDCRISSTDFLQRMIPELDGNGEPRRDERGEIVSNRPTRYSLNSLKTQFRNKCRCQSWNSKSNDSEFHKRLWSDITAEDEVANTTRNLPDLSANEISEIHSLAKGRKARVVKGKDESDGEITKKDKSDSDSTQHSVNEAAIDDQNGELNADMVENHDTQAPTKDPLDPVTDSGIAAGSIAKRRRQKNKTTMAIQHVDVDVEERCQSPMENLGRMKEKSVEDGSQLIDPALIVPVVFGQLAVPAQNDAGKDHSIQTSADNTLQDGLGMIDPALTTPPAFCQPAVSAPQIGRQDYSTEHEVADQSINGSQVKPSFATIIGMNQDRPGEYQPMLKRRASLNARDSESGAVQVDADSGPEAESSGSHLKRRKILSPLKDVNQLLQNFSATSRPGLPSLIFQDASNLASYSNTSIQPMQPPPNNSQQYGTGKATSQPLYSAPLLQPRAYVSGSPILAPLTPFHAAPPRSAPVLAPRPYSWLPPSPIVQCSETNVINAEIAELASVSARVSVLEIFKAKLMKAWWKNQVDITRGGALYGPVLNISLSQLGRDTTVRTETEMRSFMSSFNIPPHWSASSIDLRTTPSLRQAVHEAMSEAERWDTRNYLHDSPSSQLNLDHEGAFFLASAQKHKLNHRDSRFWNFTSTPDLNASLHSAFWRYKQLTGRNFAPSAYGAAFLAHECSYHDAWCEIRRQIFLPYFLRFRDPVEALAWMPELGVLSEWQGGPERWERSLSHRNDVFGCRFDGKGKRAMDPRSGKGKGKALEMEMQMQIGWGGGKKVFLPLECVDLMGYAGIDVV